MFNEGKDECCGTCRYNSFDREKESFYCDNEYSDEYGCMTAYNDFCDEYWRK